MLSLSNIPEDGRGMLKASNRIRKSLLLQRLQRMTAGQGFVIAGEKLAAFGLAAR